MEKHIIKYKKLLQQVDAWFQTVLEKHFDIVKCRPGCFDCCQGLFDIGLLDAIFVQQGMKRLKPQQLQIVKEKARELIEKAKKIDKDFAPPYSLSEWDETRIDELVLNVGKVFCPFINDEGFCSIYEYRPLVCRLIGIPVIDISGEVIYVEGCEKNPLEREGAFSPRLSLNYYQISKQEEEIIKELVNDLKDPKLRTDFRTFLPAVVLLDELVKEK